MLCLNNFPNSNSVVIMDNCRIHSQSDLLIYTNAIGADLAFLPPYSPMYNPIELSFNKYKQMLKKDRDLIALMDPFDAIQMEMDALTVSDCVNWIESVSIYNN